MAYAETVGQTAIKAESVLGIVRDIEPQFHRLMKVVSHLTVIGDRLEGSRPQEAASPLVDHPPHCMIDDLRRKREGLQMLCSQLEDAAQRIERALGDTGNAPSNRIA